MKSFKLKTGYLSVLFACGFFLIAGYQTWDYYAGYREDHATETLLHNAPKNLNSKAVQSVKARLKDKTSFRFYVIGDTQGSFDTFIKILGKAQEEKPDFIIHVADITTGGRYRQYMKMVQFIEPLAIPIIFTIGNHDSSHRGREIYANLFGPPDFYFDTGSYRFIFLDCNYEKINPDFIELPQDHVTYDYLHGFDPDQMSVLDTLINKTGHNFIIVHMPPALDTFKHHSFVRNSQLFLNVMKKYAGLIAGVFSGHIHGYGEAISDGVTYVVSGGAGNRLHEAREGITSKFNYILVNVSGNTVNHQVRFID
jgi:3',5'-cyclic AMP phosphodiesterase CpdA